MDRTKELFYVAPHTYASRVFLESPICSGSATIGGDGANQQITAGSQDVNTDVGDNNDFSGGSDWD